MSLDRLLLEPLIQHTANQMRARREARRRVDAEERVVRPPDIMTLRERLARPRPPAAWAIPGWQPAHTRVMLASQFKAGKTHLVANYLRSRIDGDPWLGGPPVAPLQGTIMLIDLEMAPQQLDTWLEVQAIRKDDRVLPVPLRGNVASFDLLDHQTRSFWATMLQCYGTTCLVLDCLRPALDALGLDEHTDAGRFLVAFDALLYEAGIDEAVVVQHMGHVNERARGDSRLRDWPDVEWRMVRQGTDERSPRFISAYGRDVDQPEQQLAFDPATRRLTLCGGSRQEAKAHQALEVVMAALTRNPTPRSGRELKEELKTSSYGRDTIDQALHLGVNLKRLIGIPGPHNAILYQCSGSVSDCPESHPPDGMRVCPVPIKRTGHRTHAGRKGNGEVRTGH